MVVAVSRLWFVLVVSCVLLLAFDLGATPPGGRAADKTLSPYFVVEGGAQFPLDSTRVEVVINNMVADVNVVQVYENASTRPINARYVFPASTRAAVHGLRMTVRDQVIEAQIQERKQAQQTFEKAKKAGKSATLLEEERPNVFTMSVANVMPGDRIEVSLRYTELLLPEEGEYEFIYPTVVGPRYSSQLQSAAKDHDHFVKTPYLQPGHAAPNSLDLRATLASGIPIQQAISPSHKLTERHLQAGLWEMSLDPSEKSGGDRDFVLRYRLAGNSIQSGLSLFDSGSEKFFLLQVEPPLRVSDEQVVPREYVFVIDVSGSMSGFPLDTAKTLIRELSQKLRPTDRFNLILFSGDSRLLSPHSLPATADNVQRAISLIEQERGGGGTELLPALTQALSLGGEPGVARSFLVITDGFVDADKTAMEYVRAHLGEANVFAFGIGSSVNRYLIEGVARAGLGEAFVVTEPAEAGEAARRFGEYVRSPVLTAVKLAFDGFQAYDLEPTAIPDVLARRPVVVFGKWRGSASGSVRLSGVSGSGPYSRSFELSAVPPQAANQALPQLWARTRIANLIDFGSGDSNQKQRAEVITLGLHYNLLTPFTSFIAVSKVVRNHSGAATDVDQPLVMPKGVSASAIGSPLQTASEPGLLATVLALALALALTARFARRQIA